MRYSLIDCVSSQLHEVQVYPQEVWCPFVPKWWRSSKKLALGTHWKQMSHTFNREPSQTQFHTSKLHRGEKKVIQQAATVISNLLQTDLKCLNIDSLISEINPLLCEFVSSITRPAYKLKSSGSWLATRGIF